MSCFLQCVSGLPELTFLVTYDAPSDELRIASSAPFPAAMVNMNITYDPGNVVVSNPPDFTQVDPTHFVLSGAYGRAVGSQVTIIDFLDAAFNPLGTWTGSVPISPPATYPLLEGIFSPAVNRVAITGQRLQTASSGQITNAAIRLASYATGCFEGIETTVDLTAPINGWSIITFTDTLLVLENASFTSCTPDDLAANFTVDGVAFSAPNYGSPPGDGYYFYEPWGDPSPYSAVIDGTTPVPP